MCGFQIKVVLSNYNPQLLGKEKPAHDSKNFNINQLSEPFDEENTMPELPPNYDFKQDAKDKQQGRT